MADGKLLAHSDGALPFMQAYGPLPQPEGQQDFREILTLWSMKVATWLVRSSWPP
jgi:hypothetical protein